MLRTWLSGALVALAAYHAATRAPVRAESPKADVPFEADHAYIKEHYTKYEYEAPMRDGIKLFTAVYVPKDASETYPILLIRTPYSLRPYGASNYPDAPRGPLKHYAKEKFI